jgi:hypothetical protein
MPEPIKNEGGTQVQSNDAGRTSAFSPDYVKELREEAASWRTKFRETESKVQTLEQQIHYATVVSSVKSEIDKRGLKINPDFITLGEDGDVTKAVDKFLEEYPQFGNTESTTQITNQKTEVKKGVRPITNERTNTNTQSSSSKNIQDIKNDPIARAKLRDQYRSALGR